MSTAFAGKVVIVTGGTSGIGAALSEELLKRGATVWVIGSRQESVEKAKKVLGAYPKARFAAVDVRDIAAVERMVKDCVKNDGRLDYLFNNAGISQKNPYTESTLADWKEMIDINLWGVIHGVNAALAVMENQGNGHIVNMSSVAALYGTPYQTLYVATKSAVIGLTDCLYYEYLPKNIFFTVVCPGDVATPIFRGRVPEGAVPAEEAARIILDGVERKERLIVFPDFMKEVLEKCKDPEFRDLAHKYSEKESREMFESPEYRKFVADGKKGQKP
ncbi:MULTISPECIES: SDR family oxidoreductase [unclassified Methanoregula]|uniref:SDR family NAD(P)-dependent oxidoreductase n=1 Tax=unclassified Methanoregula TaxID=2649730 RepID=UPI0009CFAB7D|nr:MULTISPECIES: SDR family oxidoreductase [unclassified Methanoregula]OPX62187.1 MAG: 3-ketoacyl-(acyl-carrier-protein) reductase [Methanoregula sp. PtaB.Bin085]OPY35604.1 MAG: 3-ketoacyl-(acyl-carrier-protein) reductase [Methanoregula sp. PtaU1.Bin006]